MVPHSPFRSVGYALLGLLIAASGELGLSKPAYADALLDEVVTFTGDVLYLQYNVPGLVIGAVRNGDIAIHGAGKRSDGGDTPDSDGGDAPDGDTVMRIGSITKVFTGQVLAALAADGTVSLTQTLGKTAPDLGQGADPNVAKIRLIDIATHSAGLPRELPQQPATRDAFAAWLKTETLLYPPGTGVLYSNFAFDLLSIALSEAANKPYPELLKTIVTEPLGMSDTTFDLNDEQKARLMQGHGFDGKALPNVQPEGVVEGSGGLYSTPKDLLRWMQWHLDRLSPKDAEIRMLDHAAYLMRDGLNPVQGMDESGHMDAMSLGWVVMMPEGNRPFILQKAGGFQGTFAYIAFAPARGIAAFVAINKYDFAAAMGMAEVVNEMIATLAPR